MAIVANPGAAVAVVVINISHWLLAGSTGAKAADQVNLDRMRPPTDSPSPPSPARPARALRLGGAQPVAKGSASKGAARDPFTPLATGNAQQQAGLYTTGGGTVRVAYLWARCSRNGAGKPASPF